MTSILEELLTPDLRQALIDRDWRELSEFANLLHPRVIAQSLEQTWDVDVVLPALASLPPGVCADIFQYLSVERQDELVYAFPKEQVARLLERMSHDERVDLIKRMNDNQQASIMPLVAKVEREDIMRLARHEEGTAGAIMTTDYAWLPAEISANEAINRLRREAPNRETIYYVYVTDSERHLIGFVSLKDLILARPNAVTRDVMREDVFYVQVETDVEKVAEIMARYDLIAIPVVDEENKLVGIITHDDVIDVVIEEATEDVYRMGAVEPLDVNYIDSPFWQVIRKRIVWLGLLFFAELFTIAVLSGHEELLARLTVLTIFMPVITATGGNSGSQAASMITRSLALGQIKPGDWWRIAVRELSSGVVMGAMIGGLGIATVFVLQREAMFAVVLILALIVVTTAGSLIGSLMPLVFKRVGMDPAISSGPFVASLVDVMGLFIYLTIASIMLIEAG